MLSGFERLQLLADKEINFVSIKNSMLSMSWGVLAAVPTNMQDKEQEKDRHTSGIGVVGGDHI